MKPLPRRTTAPRTGMSRRLLATGALLCIGVLPLSACSLFNPPLERDESVHAIFDAEQDIVKMPLDEYLYYELGTHYEYTAYQIAMKQCYAEHGQSYTEPAPQSESAPRGDPGRMYGPWNVEYAKKYGFQKRDPNAKAPISVTPGASLSPEERLLIECEDKARETLDAAVPEGKRPENDVQSTYSRISTEAVNAVYGSKLHRELEEKWKQCVSNRGLTPIKAGAVAEETPMAQAKYEKGWDAPPTEEEIRIVTIQAECNREVGMTQQLYDLEAQYQMPLIRKHQAQLEQERQAAKDLDEKYRQYVMDNQ